MFQVTFWTRPHVSYPPAVIPATAGTNLPRAQVDIWVPAFAGMTAGGGARSLTQARLGRVSQCLDQSLRPIAELARREPHSHHDQVFRRHDRDRLAVVPDQPVGIRGNA